MHKYDPNKTWRWNLEHAPLTEGSLNADPILGDWSWCGLSVASPLGISAGPLLDSRWLLAYADRGFDILVYKTVRSQQRECYALPNLVPVSTTQIERRGLSLPESAAMSGSWAVSFGMPSQPPSIWRADVQSAREQLPIGKILIVSIVGTQDTDIVDSEESLNHLADDFATCAQWAIQSGAHGIEANFSCPNVSTSDGQLYQQPAAAKVVAERIRDSIGDSPLVLKIGRVVSAQQAEEQLAAVGPFIQGLAMTNSIAAQVTKAGDERELLFEGQPRGICGDAIRDASISQIAMFRRLLNDSPFDLDLVGVGGISTARHARDYLAAGASSVGLATSVMTDPDVGLRIRRQWAES